MARRRSPNKYTPTNFVLNKGKKDEQVRVAHSPSDEVKFMHDGYVADGEYVEPETGPEPESTTTVAKPAAGQENSSDKSAGNAPGVRTTGTTAPTAR